MAEPRVRAEAVESGIHPEVVQVFRVFFQGLFQPDERLILVPQGSVNQSESQSHPPDERRSIAWFGSWPPFFFPELIAGGAASFPL